MGRKSIALALIAVSWVAIALFVRANRDTLRLSAAIDSVEQGDGSYALEETFVAFQQEGSRVFDAYHYSAGDGSRVLRVLVLGDSYTSGAGLTDLSRVWPNLFAEQGSQRLGVRIEVVSVSMGGASWYTYAAWMESALSGKGDLIKAHPEAAEALNHPFDLIIVGYTHNDAVPRIGDSEPDATFGVVGINADDEWRVQQGIIPDPNETAFSNAAAAMRNAAGRIPVIILPTSYHSPTSTYIDNKKDTIEENGFAVAATDNTEKAVAAFGIEMLSVSPNDLHPGPAALQVLASDAVVAVKQAALSPVVAEMRTESANVVVVPFTVATKPSQGSALIDSLSEAARSSETCPREFHVVIGKATLQCRAGDEPNGEIDGETIAARYAPCHRFDAPYLLIWNENWRNISIRAGRVESSVIVFAAGYDRNGFPTERRIGTIDTGMTIAIALRSGENAIAVVSSTAGCPESGVRPPRVELEIDWS